MTETLEEKIERVTKEEVDIVEYREEWSTLFEEEKNILLTLFPKIITRVEHFGSTSVCGLVSKNVVDILAETASFEQAENVVAKILEARGYDYFPRPRKFPFTEETPRYAWFIKRDEKGIRTHHIHIDTKDSPLWESLYFRDYLREFSEIAEQYASLKKELAKTHKNDRIAYTNAKTEFVLEITRKAKIYYGIV